MLAAMLLAQSCVVPAMASDTDTYPQEDGYYVETAPEEEDPQYWAEAHRGEIQNSQLAAYGVDHSPCSRYVRRFFVYFSGSGTYRPPQDAGLRRRPAYHPAETRAGVVRAAFNECRY